MRKNKKLLITIGLLSLLILGTWSSGVFSKSQRDFFATVRRNIEVYGQVYKQTANNYVEEVDPDKFMRAGINGMLDRLDPYSTFLETEAVEDMEIMTRGKYYGVGMRISTRNGWPTAAEQPFPNSPAEKAGIREGDQIIEIDGESTKGLTLSKTAGKLRGKEKGSTVVIKIRRVGVDEPMTFSLIRDEIEVSDIQFAGFVEPGIGLIKLNSFDRSAEKQVTNAIEDLLDKGMESLILDLRGNPGGLLDVAVSVSNNFLPKGELVVYTKGRDVNSTKEYRTTKNPIFGSLPLVVLINQYSASASEIVAGAIQDLDRGVIIGEQSFGKGLVQTVMPIDRTADSETSLKLTTAKYYLPSGRLIQKMDVFDHGKNSVLWNSSDDDSEKEETKEEIESEKFYTRNSRAVSGGGGITPDIESSNENTTRYVGELMRQSLFFNFSLEYAAKHPELADDFTVDDQILNDFFTFVDEKDFDYEPTGMNYLKDIEKVAKEDEFYDTIESSITAMRQQFDAVKESEKKKSTDDIKYLIKRELVAKMKGNDASYATSFDRDQTLKEAVGVLKDRDKYNNILGVQTASN